MIKNKVITAFNDKLRYRGAEIEFYSGKKVSLKDTSACLEKIDGGARIVAKLDEYTVEFFYQEIEKDVISCKAVLTPNGKVKDKVKTITSLKAFCPLGQDAPLIVNQFIDVGIIERQKRKKKGISENYLSVFEKDCAKNAVTFTMGFPAKFYSYVAYEQRKDGILFGVNTLIPSSFEGVVFSEECFVSINKLTTEAMEWTVNRYATDKPFVTPIGWSTWDYYFTSATENDVKENADFIAQDEVLREKVRYIALDDGWQQREGDWKSGSRYPSGLKSLVEYIKAKGFEAGIWIAPTRLHFLCGTIMRRNDFLIRNDLGDPVMDEDMYVLDPTHPDGERFLRETFKYLSDCGFTFYKLDFVSNLLQQTKFYDKTVGPYDALKRLFEIARESVTKGSHLMGCSLPYGAEIGVADSRRVGLDIHNTFKHLKKCLEIATFQYAANEKLYRNDLDYLLVRGPQTSAPDTYNVLLPWKGMYANEPTEDFRWRDGEDFSYSEAKCWCAIMLMSGSSVFLGDKLPLLNEKGLKLVQKTVQNADFHAATPVMTGREGLPEIWRKESTGSVYVFNFGEEKKKYLVEMQDGEYVDIFTEKRYQVVGGKVEVDIEKHDCVCFYKR